MAQNFQYTTNADEIQNCWTCDFFADLDRIAETFTRTIYGHFGDAASSLIASLLYVYLIVQMIRIMTGAADWPALIQIFWTVFFCSLAMTLVENFDLFNKWILSWPEQFALLYAMDIVALFGEGGKNFIDPTQAGIPGAGGAFGEPGYGYSHLVSLVEAQVIQIFEIVSDIFKSAKIESNGILIMIASVAVLLPYLFVVGIFAAFLLEAMFAFVAMGVLAPMLVAVAPFSMGRAFAISALRIMLGAALTVIFAAGAMGFTIAAVDKHGSHVLIQHSNLAATEKENAICNNLGAIAGGIIEEGETSDQSGLDTAKCKAIRKKRAGEQSSRDRAFILLFVMGFASVLLHLKAKTFASNLSGANDGAGPAAATVAGAKMTLGAGLLAASRFGFGQGGAAPSATQALASLPGGAQLAQHGAVGSVPAAAAAIMDRFAGRTGPASDRAQWAGGGDGPSYSGGGGAGGASPRMEKTLDRLVDFLEQNSPRKGSV